MSQTLIETNRREATRYAKRGRISHRGRSTPTIDLSQTGARAILHGNVNLGQELDLQVTLETVVFDLRGEVVWREPFGHRSQVVGLRFKNGREELDMLGWWVENVAETNR